MRRSGLAIRAEHDDEQDTVRAEVRFKNARLYDAMVDTLATLPPQSRAYPPVARFCRHFSLANTHVYLLLNLQMSPLRRRGRGYRGICLKLADALGLSVEWLFPETLYQRYWPRYALHLSSEQLQQLADIPHEQRRLAPTQDAQVEQQELQRDIHRVLATLSPQEQRVLRLRFGFDGEPEATLRDIGQQLDLSSTRVRQIEAKAFRRLLHHSRRDILRAHVVERKADLPVCVEEELSSPAVVPVPKPKRRASPAPQPEPRFCLWSAPVSDREHLIQVLLQTTPHDRSVIEAAVDRTLAGRT